MSTETYPEVSVDESGIVPPQTTRPPEWPKKLRTLTAAELDRLTIDSDGRFYWDGKMVDYGTGSSPQPAAEQPSESLNRSLEILDRASFDLGARKTPATIEGQLAEPVVAAPPAVDLDALRADAIAAAMAEVSQVNRVSESSPLRLSLWQTIGAVIVVVAAIVGACSMATYGYVAARDWGCRTGTFQNGCPAAAPKAAHADIPA